MKFNKDHVASGQPGRLRTQGLRKQTRAFSVYRSGMDRAPAKRLALAPHSHRLRQFELSNVPGPATIEPKLPVFARRLAAARPPAPNRSTRRGRSAAAEGASGDQFGTQLGEEGAIRLMLAAESSPTAKTAGHSSVTPTSAYRRSCPFTSDSVPTMPTRRPTPRPRVRTSVGSCPIRRSGQTSSRPQPGLDPNRRPPRPAARRRPVAAADRLRGCCARRFEQRGHDGVGEGARPRRAR